MNNNLIINKTIKLFIVNFLFAFTVISQSANASLIARTIDDDTFGTIHAYYDDVLDLTWLKDANFAKTSGYDNDGKMAWSDANAWAAQLSLGQFDDWRLTSMQMLDYNFTFNGTSSRGYNITSTIDELSYMFYVNLGIKGVCDGGANEDKFCDKSGDSFHSTPVNTIIDTKNFGNNVPIDNLMSNGYWNDIELAANPDYAWLFYHELGYTYTQDKTRNSYSWAVRQGDVTQVASSFNLGDVSQVPEPSTIAVFSLALVGLVSRKKLIFKH